MSGGLIALPHYTAKEETAAFIDTLSPYLKWVFFVLFAHCSFLLTDFDLIM